MFETTKTINATTTITCSNVHQTFNYPVIKTTTTTILFLVVANPRCVSFTRGSSNKAFHNMKIYLVHATTSFYFVLYCMINIPQLRYRKSIMSRTQQLLISHIPQNTMPLITRKKVKIWYKFILEKTETMH